MLRIPHAEPFRFLGAVDESLPGAGRFSWRFPDSGDGFALKLAPQLVCVEAMAQAAAALFGSQAGGGTDGEGGVLASVDRVRFSGAPQPGDPLTVMVSVRKRFGDLALIDGEVRVHHRLVAQAELAVRREVGG